MSPEAEIISTRFTKSIIKSSAALSYVEAQARMDDGYILFYHIVRGPLACLLTFVATIKFFHFMLSSYLTVEKMVARIVNNYYIFFYSEK